MIHACHVHSLNAHTHCNCPEPSPGIARTAHGCSTASLCSLTAFSVALGEFPHISLPVCSSRLSIHTHLLFLAFPSPHHSIHFSLAGLFTKPLLGNGVCVCVCQEFRFLKEKRLNITRQMTHPKMSVTLPLWTCLHTEAPF